MDAHGIDWNWEPRPRIEIDENGVEHVVYQYEVVIKHPEKMCSQTFKQKFALLPKSGGALQDKLDLLVDLDFRIAASALYADVVLPTATCYEKDDLSSTEVHPFQAAVDPLWEARSDWDIFRTLAQAVSKVATEVGWTCRKFLGVEEKLPTLKILTERFGAKIFQPLPRR